MKRKLLFPVVVLVVSSIACSTFTRSTPENTAIVESTPTIETTMSQVEVVATPTTIPTPDLNSITTAEELPPLTFDEILDARVESGEWTEGEGLLHLMKTFTGELSIHDDSELQSVYDIDGSGIIMRVQEFLSVPGNDSQTKTELERMLNNLVPSAEILKSVSSPRAEGNGLKVASPNQSNNHQSVLCEDLRRFGFEEIISEEVICLEYIDIFEDGSALLYYPKYFIGEPVFETMTSETAGAMRKSIEFYDSTMLQSTKPEQIHIYYSPGNTGEEIAFKRFEEDEGECSISLYSELVSHSGYDFGMMNQAIATFIFYCYEDSTFNPQMGKDSWWYYGAAEYFSNQVYPDVNREHRNNKFFDLRSVVYPIGWMRQENFVFFQYLGNRWGDFRLLTMLYDGNLTENLHVHVSEDEFHGFVVDYLSIGIQDSDGSSRIKSETPPEQYEQSIRRKVSDEGDLPVSANVFVAARYMVEYEKEKRFLQESSSSEGDGRFSAVEADLYQDITAWSAPPPEIRSTCDEDKKYVYVVTTTRTGKYEPPINVSKVEEASCDPCLLGVWKVDNEAFSQYMMDVFVLTGVDFTQSLQGMGEFYLYTSGDYFLGFGEGGEMGTWRKNFTVTVGITNLTSWDTVIESVGKGNYSADGLHLTISDLYDQVISSTAYQGDADISEDVTDVYLFRPSYSADLSDEDPTKSDGRKQYKCDKDQLVIYNEPERPLVFDRADALIPTPIPTATNP